ncbi:MAG: sigma-54-dependent Fis family transcriptional regulator, partial [Acidobacteria bacterium]
AAQAAAPLAAPPAPPEPAVPGGATARGGERERIVAALEAAHWNRHRAAGALGVSRSTLWRRMRELGIE